MRLLKPGLRHDAHSADLLEKMKKTYAGQAHWADESIGRTCLECWHWLDPDGKHHRNSFGQLKEHKCFKYRNLRNTWGSRFPHYATACQFFEQNPVPPRTGR
jgi:hypothetical protein